MPKPPSCPASCFLKSSWPSAHSPVGLRATGVAWCGRTLRSRLGGEGSRQPPGNTGPASSFASDAWLCLPCRFLMLGSLSLFYRDCMALEVLLGRFPDGLHPGWGVEQPEVRGQSKCCSCQQALQKPLLHSATLHLVSLGDKQTE